MILNVSIVHSFLLLSSMWKCIVSQFFLSHLPIEKNLNCFHILAIMDTAAMNTGIQILAWAKVFISLG